MRDIHAVILDMDGLMFDTEQLSLSTLQQAGGRFGVELTDADLLPLRGLPVPAFCAALAALVPPEVDVQALWSTAKKAFADVLHRDIVAPKKPGLDLFLQRVKARNLPLALASSTKRATVEWMLEHAGVRDYFTALVCGDEVAHGKPAPDIFLAAARALGADPAHCLALEDAPHGAAAALAAGMMTIMVPDLTQPDEALAARLTAVCPSLLDVRF
ncbi:MAG: HAD family phosphatase [Oscillospiraceae bacterium]|jgi:HAD superfamily hydrolase (TIGR01509 family)|nr:HAD family phosphatase [Oscillospiraceae bacterium]